jgi:hypothetical protein
MNACAVLYASAPSNPSATMADTAAASHAWVVAKVPASEVVPLGWLFPPGSPVSMGVVDVVVAVVAAVAALSAAYRVYR